MKRYIGNKQKLLHHIDEFIQDNNIKANSFFDLFSGTGSVADYFKSKYDVSANDIMYYSYVILKAKLSFKSSPEFKKFVSKYKTDPINHINNLTNSNGKKIIFENFSPKGGRKYFTEENAIKIDLARNFIDDILAQKEITKNEWYYLLACIISTANSKGNTTGTFGAYLKYFSASSIKLIEFKHIEMNVGNKGVAYSLDGKKLVKKIETDILYLDPPYTAIDYSQSYHFLESLALYDTNEYKGITGRRIENLKVSKYTKSTTALEELTETIKLAKGAKNIIISYSTHGIISLDEIKKLLAKFYKEVKLKKFEYSKYRNVYKNDKGDLYEVLILGKGRKKWNQY